MSTQTTAIRWNRIGVNRRHFLRGLGVAVALPAMESLGMGGLRAAESESVIPGPSAGGTPLRTAFVYFPNGAIPSAWWPEGGETDFRLGPTLQPLEELRSKFQVLGGLDHLNANPGKDGGGDHARANGTFLTGVRMKKSATDIRAGISIDQVMARQVGDRTRFPSLQLTCDASRKTGGCDSGYSCAYQYNLSWSSESTPVTPEGNPRLVFERLFGAGAPGERAANFQRRLQEQRSVLDFVMEDARTMQRRLGVRDQEKLDQYLSGVRELELRIQHAERFGAAREPGVATPPGVPAEYAEYLRVMYDMLLLAFQTDSTRVGTLLLAHDGSNRSFGEIGISEGHHDLSHHQNRKEMIQKVGEIDRWYVTQFAAFLRRMQEIPDSNGRSLLDNSMIVYGGGNADGNRHTHSNLPILLAGGGGGSLSPGRFVNHGGKPASNLFLSLADRMGVSGLERFGDSSGRLAGL